MSAPPIAEGERIDSGATGLDAASSSRARATNSGGAACTNLSSVRSASLKPELPRPQHQAVWVVDHVASLQLAAVDLPRRGDQQAVDPVGAELQSRLTAETGDPTGCRDERVDALRPEQWPAHRDREVDPDAPLLARTRWRFDRLDPYCTNGSSCMLLVNAGRSLRSNQCTAGNSQCAWRWLSRCTKSTATNRSNCSRAASSFAPSGPDTTGLPELITKARIWPSPGVVISSGRSARPWAPAIISRPRNLLRWAGLARSNIRSASTYPRSNRRPPGRSIQPVMTLRTWPSHSAMVPASCRDTPVRVTTIAPRARAKSRATP
jgi:hypothetical protein